MKEGKRFFFEKKNQKTFVPGAVDACAAYGDELVRFTSVRRKSFLVLFFKKEPLAFSLCAA